MDDQRPDDATKLAAFPLHSVMPRVCVAEARQQMRTFLAETLEDLGCVTRECVHVAELSAELGTRPPDLVVIGSSAGGIRPARWWNCWRPRNSAATCWCSARALRPWWRR